MGAPLPSPCPKQNCCNSTTASLPSASAAHSARDSTIPVEPQRGDLAQPRPTAWVNKVPILTLSPVRAKYEVRVQSQTYRTSNSIPWLFRNCRIYLSRPFRACSLEGVWTQAVGLGCDNSPLWGSNCPMGRPLAETVRPVDLLLALKQDAGLSVLKDNVGEGVAARDLALDLGVKIVLGVLGFPVAARQAVAVAQGAVRTNQRAAGL